MSNLVTIKTANLLTELAVAKTYLEDNGIPCFMKDELAGQVYSIGSSALGGIKLQVKEEDCEEAIKLLIEGGFATLEDYEPDKSMLFISRIYEKIASFFKGDKK